MQAIECLKLEGHPVIDEDLKHISPARHGHVNHYGRFIFEVEEELKRKELRPLRSYSSVSPIWMGWHIPVTYRRSAKGIAFYSVDIPLPVAG